MNEALRQAICDMDHEGVVVVYDLAFVGDADYSIVVIWFIKDYGTMVKCLVDRDGMSETEAIEFIDYNTIRALPYAGEKAPIIMYKIMM